MSLIPFNDSNSNWSVVLRDNEKQAVVLYDPASQKLSLVNDPSLFDRLRSNDRARLSFVNGSDRNYSGGTICSHCGQLIQEGERLERRTDDASNSAARVVRNVKYFQLLDSATESEQVPVSFGISESAFSQGYFDRFFQMKSQLGRGSRGAVYLVEHILDGVSLGLFALKKVPVGDNHEWLEKVLAEVHLLRLLSHPNLVSYNHVWLESSSISNFAPAVPCAFILQEYCNGGTLEDYIRSRATTAWGNSKRDRVRRQSQGALETPLKADQLLAVPEIISFMHDVVSGVVYLHQNQIIHRDLKPSNCLMVNPSITGKLPTVLVSDFGEGQLEGTNRGETGSTGTLEYCAPELVTLKRGHLGQFTKKTDVFSLGMILHYLCFSKLPYSKGVWDDLDDVESLMKEVKAFQGFYGNGERNDLPLKIYELLTSMLSLKPKNRPSAEQVLSILEELAGKRYSPVIEEEVVDNDNGGGNGNGYENDGALQLFRDPAPLPFEGTERHPQVDQALPFIKFAIIAVELANTWYLKPIYTNFALVLIGTQIPTTSPRTLTIMIIAFFSLSLLNLYV